MDVLVHYGRESVIDGVLLPGIHEINSLFGKCARDRDMLDEKRRIVIIRCFLPATGREIDIMSAAAYLGRLGWVPGRVKATLPETEQRLSEYVIH